MDCNWLLISRVAWSLIEISNIGRVVVMFRTVFALSKAIALAVVLCFSVASTNALAEATGWVTPSTIDKISKSMNRKRMMPVSIKCKGDSKSSSVRASMLINMTFSPNPNRKRWRWVWGNRFGATKHDLQKKGWKLVSTSGFVRPATGLAVRCGVFHAP